MASRFSFLRLAMTTFAPASASRAAIALPMPRPPPVTRATFPDRSMARAHDAPYVLYYARQIDWVSMARTAPMPSAATS